MNFDFPTNSIAKTVIKLCIAFVVLCIAQLIMPLGRVGFFFANITIALPIIGYLIVKYNAVKKIYIKERRENYLFYRIRSSHIFGYIFYTVYGCVVSEIIMIMLFLSSSYDIVVLLLLLPVALVFGKIALHFTSYRPEYAEARSMWKTELILKFVGGLLYAIVYLALFGVNVPEFTRHASEELSFTGFGYFVAQALELLYFFQDKLAESENLCIFFPFMLSGGILFNYLYKYFAAFLISGERYLSVFMPFHAGGNVEACTGLVETKYVKRIEGGV